MFFWLKIEKQKQTNKLDQVFPLLSVLSLRVLMCVFMFLHVQSS